MKRNRLSSLSVLSSVAFLFLMLLTFALIVTNQFLDDFVKRSNRVSLPVIITALALSVGLLFTLILYLVRAVRDLRTQQVGSRFKLRLLGFFSGLVLLVGGASILFMGNLFRSAFDVWFIKDTRNGLAFGVDLALKLRNDQANSLGQFAQSPLFPGLMSLALENPQSTFASLKKLQDNIAAIQIWDGDAHELLFQGENTLRVQAPLKQYRSSLSYWDSLGNLAVFRYYRSLELVQADRRVRTCTVMLVAILPPDFDDQASNLSKTRRDLEAYAQLPLSYSWTLFLILGILFIPLLLTGLLMSFFLSDEILGPLVNLEHALKKVAAGDYSTRLIAQRKDILGPFVGSFNDMTGRLEDTKNALIQTERLQTWQEIAQRMAHEIKNPLTPIRLSAERILRKYQRNDPDFSRSLEDGVSIILQEVQAISSLLGDFRAFSKVPELRVEDVLLAEFVNEAWALYEGMGDYSFDASSISPELRVVVDRAQFLQIFRNLFQNAIDAIRGERGKIEVFAHVLRRFGDEVVRVQIRDNGRGMTEEEKIRAFSPYFTTKDHGSGLGLVVVEKIILEHHGRIWIESAKDEGTSIIFEIPISGKEKQS